jgi:hypothetical protein
MKTTKKLKLKREWCFVLGMLTMTIITISIIKYIGFYNDYLEKCDNEKGYTCNIFGQ